MKQHRQTFLRSMAFAVMLALVLSMMPVPAFADSLPGVGIPGLIVSYDVSEPRTTFSGLRYQTYVESGDPTNGYVLILGHEDTDISNLRIPDTIEGYPVEKIEEYAFYGYESLKTLSLPKNLKTIGNAAFHYCRALTEVTLPEGMKKLNDDAFGGCSSLEKVTLPSTLEKIGYEAFHDCKSLNEIQLPGSLTEIGGRAFYNCKQLTSLHIPASVTTVGDNVISGCDSLTNLTAAGNSSVRVENGLLITEQGKRVVCCIPSFTGACVVPAGVTAIADTAFSGCEGLTEITLPDSLETIGYAAFSDCTGLMEITVPAGVIKIDRFTFSGCTALKTVELPAGLTEMGDMAFDGCTALEAIRIPAGMETLNSGIFRNCTSLTDVTLPDTLKTIEAGTFSGCASLKEIRLPESLTELGNAAFDGCTSLEIVNLPETITEVKNSLFHNCTSLKALELHDGVTGIGSNAFSGCTALAQINLPDGLTSIGYGAFQNCIGLKNVTLPAGLTSLGSYAFEGCTGLTEISVPANLTNLGSGAFISCTGLTEFYIPATLTEIGTGAFGGCTGLKDLTLEAGHPTYTVEDGVLYQDNGTTLHTVPAGKTGKFTVDSQVAQILSSAFSGCSGLTEIVLPENLTVIESSAFENCTGLTAIELPEGLSTVGFNAFSNCTGLTSIDLPDSLTELGYSAFFNCDSLTHVEIPAGVTKVPSGCFASCDSLTAFSLAPGNTAYTERDGILYDAESGALVMMPTGISGTYTTPAGVTVLGYGSFENCDVLTDLILADDVVTVDMGAFSNCDELESIEWSASSAEIPMYSVNNCVNLKEITIPASVTSIAYHATSGCDSLRDVYYDGTAQMWAEVFVDSTNTPVLNANIHFWCTEDQKEHSWDEGTVTLMPTEYAPGELLYTCTVCGDTRREPIEQLEHIHDYTPAVTEPTCKDGGYTTYTCRCGDSYVADETEPSEQYHAFGDWVIIRPATCTEDGLQIRACKICGRGNPMPVYTMGHSYDRTYVEPTCTEDGYRLDKCSTCGYTRTLSYVSELVEKARGVLWLPVESTIWEYGPEYMACNVAAFYCNNDLTDSDFITVPADEFEEQLHARFVVSEEQLAQIRNFPEIAHRQHETYLVYDAEARTYTIDNRGGMGGWTLCRTYMGMVDNGDTYDFYYLDTHAQYLSQVLPEGVNDYDYWKEHADPVTNTLEYDGLKYINDGDSGPYTIVSVGPNGQKATVEENGDVIRIISVTDITEADLPDHFDDPDGKALGHDFVEGICTRCGAKDPNFVFESPFTDVSENDYFFDPILWAVNEGIASGTGENKFSPNASCSRAQVVTFLWRAMGKPAPVSRENPFKDVSEGDYFYDAVLWAVENHITSGTGGDKFSPNSACSRAQVVTFLWRAMGEPAPETTENPFRDVAETEFFYAPVLWAVENQITSGTEQGKFNPNASCSRGQVVTFLYRAMK